MVETKVCLCLVPRPQASGLGVGQQFVPDRFGLSDDDRVGVASGLVGQRRDMQTAQDDARSRGPITVGKFVRFVDLRTKAGYGDKVDVLRNFRLLSQVGGLEVFAAVPRGGQAGKRQQAQTG